MQNLNNLSSSLSLRDIKLSALPERVQQQVRDLFDASENIFSDLSTLSQTLLLKGKTKSAFILGREIYTRTTTPEHELCCTLCAAARKIGEYDFALHTALESLKHFDESCSLYRELLLAGLNSSEKIDLSDYARMATKLQPESARNWQLRAQVAEKNADFELAIKCWKQAISLAPEERGYVFALLDAFIKQGSDKPPLEVYRQYREGLNEAAQSIIRSELKRLSEAPETGALARPLLALQRAEAQYYLHEAFYEYDDIIESARDIVLKKPTDLNSFILLLKGYLRSAAFDKAEELLAFLRQEFPKQQSRLLSLQAQILDSQGLYAEAMNLLQSQDLLIDGEYQHASFLAYRLCRIGQSHIAYSIAKQIDDYFNATTLRAPFIRKRLALIEIAMNKPDQAMRSFASLKEITGNTFTEQHPDEAMWLAMQNGDIAEARRICAMRNQKQPHHVLYKSSPPQEIKAAETESLARKQIRMFTMVHNELPKLKAFLTHYRRLGIEVFYIVDNDSTDGTHEYLLQQPDVRLFYSDVPFGRAGFGIWWINYLVQRYGQSHWCMHADIDELLVYPHCEEISVQQLTEYMDQHGQEALHSYMLDVFPKQMADVLDWDGSVHPLELCPYFDDNVWFHGITRSPWVEVWGGFRARVMGDGNGWGQLSTKTPLFKAVDGFKLLLGSHYTTPVVTSDVTSACLHIKFLGDVEKISAERIEHNAHHDSAVTFRQYLTWLDRLDFNDDLRGKHSHRYTGSKSLLERGLIKTSVAYEQFAKTQTPVFNAMLPRVFILTPPNEDLDTLRQTLRAAGLQGEVCSSRPFHTKTDLLDAYGGSQIFFGFAAMNDFEYLYHLIPESHFLIPEISTFELTQSLEKLARQACNSSSLSDIRKIHADHKQFQSYGREQRATILSLVCLTEGTLSWFEAARRYQDRVQAFFATRDPGRFVMCNPAEQQPLRDSLKRLNCFQHSLF